jgi:hypothetical protein
MEDGMACFLSMHAWEGLRFSWHQLELADDIAWLWEFIRNE